MNDSFELTLHSSLTKEDWDKIADVGFRLLCARIPGCITDGEYNKILLKRLPENEPLEIELSLEAAPQESEG